jgi:hypothetical protein
MFAAITVVPVFAAEEAKADLDPFVKAMAALAAGIGLGIAAAGADWDRAKLLLPPLKVSQGTLELRVRSEQP